MNDLYFVIRAMLEGMVGSEYTVELDNADPVTVKITGHSQARGASVSRVEIKGKPYLTMITNPDGTQIIEAEWPSNESQWRVIARIYDQLTKPRAQI